MEERKGSETKVHACAPVHLLPYPPSLSRLDWFRMETGADLQLVQRRIAATVANLTGRERCVNGSKMTVPVASGA